MILTGPTRMLCCAISVHHVAFASAGFNSVYIIQYYTVSVDFDAVFICNEPEFKLTVCLSCKTLKWSSLHDKHISIFVDALIYTSQGCWHFSEWCDRSANVPPVCSAVPLELQCVGVDGIWLSLRYFGLQVDTVVWCCYVTSEGLFSTICTDDNRKRWRDMNGKGRRRFVPSTSLARSRTRIDQLHAIETCYDLLPPLPVMEVTAIAKSYIWILCSRSILSSLYA